VPKGPGSRGSIAKECKNHSGNTSNRDKGSPGGCARASRRRGENRGEKGTHRGVKRRAEKREKLCHQGPGGGDEERQSYQSGPVFRCVKRGIPGLVVPGVEREKLLEGVILFGFSGTALRKDKRARRESRSGLWEGGGGIA